MLASSKTVLHHEWIAHPHTETLAPTASMNTDSSIDLDSACMVAMGSGERQALISLVERWQLRLINFFYRSTGNRSDAEDLAQETFIELYKAAPRYQAQGNFKAFLFTLARRRLIDSYRKQARKPLHFVDPTDFTMEQVTEETDNCSEIEEAFQLALTALPENQRNAILMRQQQELSYEEIAEALDASVSAVKTWIHRARQHLRDALSEYHPQS